MKLKKWNAALGLLSVVFILLHVGYSIFSYLTFYYNPFMTNLLAIPFIVLVCAHAVCGMLSVSMQKDGSRLDLYPKQNVRTILQRVSAALIFPLLIVHINTFAWMRAASEGGKTFLIILLFVAEIALFAVVITHVATSLTRGLITLGWLGSARTLQILDRIIYVIGAVCFVLAIFSVVRGQIAMFLH